MIIILNDFIGTDVYYYILIYFDFMIYLHII